MSPENFLKELYKRTIPVPSKGKFSNNFLTVSMDGVCPVMFEQFLKKQHDKASTRIRGNICYIEILNGVDIYRVFYGSVFTELDSRDSGID